MHRLAEVGEAKGPQHQHHHHRWHRNQESQPAGVFGTKIIQAANEEDGQAGADFRMGDLQDIERRKRADRRRHDVIGDQQESADNGDDLRTMAHTGIDPAAIGVMFGRWPCS